LGEDGEWTGLAGGVGQALLREKGAHQNGAGLERRTGAPGGRLVVELRDDRADQRLGGGGAIVAELEHRLEDPLAFDDAAGLAPSERDGERGDVWQHG